MALDSTSGSAPARSLGTAAGGRRQHGLYRPSARRPPTPRHPGSHDRRVLPGHRLPVQQAGRGPGQLAVRQGHGAGGGPDPARSTFSLLGIFLDAAATVADLLDDANVTFRKADEIANLNDIDLESGFFNDTEAEDKLSSLILVGPRSSTQPSRPAGTGRG